MFKGVARGIGAHIIFKTLKRTMPLWLLPILGIFFVMLTISVISDFFTDTSEDPGLLPISQEAVSDYIKYESSSVLNDEVAYERVYIKELNTDRFNENYLNENELYNMSVDHRNKITLNKREITWPYRSYYELLSAMEIVSDKENIQKISWNENFKTEFKFTDNDIKHYVNEFVVVETFIDGKKTDDDRYQINYVYVRPAAQLKSVSTIFNDIVFEYNKETINETGWSRSKSVKRTTIKRKDKKIKKKDT